MALVPSPREVLKADSDRDFAQQNQRVSGIFSRLLVMVSFQVNLLEFQGAFARNSQAISVRTINP